MNKQRCEWVTEDPLYITYHDEEWGRFEHFCKDDYLFEMLTLEGAQASLSWLTILKRRENYRMAFQQFQIEKVANMTEEDVQQLLQNKGIIRNERKIRSVIQNAQAILSIQEEYGSFHAFLWEFIGKKRIWNNWAKDDEVPASTDLSVRLSKTLKKKYFSFVGPIICYSFMQAIGIVVDHTEHCFLYESRKG